MPFAIPKQSNAIQLKKWGMGFLDQRILVGIEGYLNDEAAQEE